MIGQSSLPATFRTSHSRPTNPVQRGQEVYLDLLRRPVSPKFGELEPDEQDALAYYFADSLGVADRHVPLWLDGTFREIESEMLAAALAGQSLYLWGEIGPGKTAALSGMVKEWYLFEAQKYPNQAYHTLPLLGLKAKFVTHHELVDGLHDDIRETGSFFDDCCKVPFLIIDDIGAGHQDPGGFHLSKLEQLIDDRWGSNRRTWVTSNVDPREMKRLPGWERIYSRLGDREWMRAFHLAAWDRRLSKTKPKGK